MPVKQEKQALHISEGVFSPEGPERSSLLSSNFNDSSQWCCARMAKARRMGQTRDSQRRLGLDWRRSSREDSTRQLERVGRDFEAGVWEGGEEASKSRDRVWPTRQ